MILTQQTALFEDTENRMIPPRSIWKLADRNIFLGTSGYSYDDWIGPFYPRDTRKTSMLDYYQHFFPVVELNFTYYTMPRASTLYQLGNRAPEMRFSVKAHQSLTHKRSGNKQEWREFADAMRVYHESDRLVAVLFQFPYSFKCSQSQFDYLDELAEFFEPLPLVFEFRHLSWFQDETYSLTRKRHVALCSVDAPRLPGLTSSFLFASPKIAYLRLHGRNAHNWFNGDNITRYDYTYEKHEVHDIIRSILALAEKADKVYVFANNHPRAQAIETVCSLALGLDEAGSLETF
jgi:uncharacterized protein YecE (DUF72 family)